VILALPGVWPWIMNRMAPTSAHRDGTRRTRLPAGSDDDRQRLLEIGTASGILARVEDQNLNRRLSVIWKATVIQSELPSHELAFGKDIDGSGPDRSIRSRAVIHANERKIPIRLAAGHDFSLLAAASFITWR
jgi:hypothetical protein